MRAPLVMLAAMLAMAAPVFRGAAQQDTVVRSLPDTTDARDAQGTGSLAGLWNARLTIDTASAGGRAIVRREIEGQIAFRPIPQAPAGTPSATGVHPGGFELALGDFGIAAPTSDALGWYVGRDSVRIQLSPVVDGATVLLRGVVSGDRITGMWIYATAERALVGRFTMQRARQR
jgi:hypothetical protein